MDNLIRLYWPAIIESKDANKDRIVNAIKGIYSHDVDGDMKCLIHMIFSLCEAAKSRAIGYNDITVYQRISLTANQIESFIEGVCYSPFDLK